jgi:L,D-peptidoglycan transpeptidase YkuD (ErfK/YbiS/YcfS/YnhG family)
MPYLYTSKNLICVDDTHSPYYNKIILAHGDEKSFEFMKRKDAQYQLGIVVAHNKNAQEKRGSCIFLHVEKAQGKPTVGCTSMRYKDIQKITQWLDQKKHPLLIQIPKAYLKEVIKIYPQLNILTKE